MRLPRRRPAKLPEPDLRTSAGRVVTLFWRPGCTLCEQAEIVAAPLAKRLRFRIEKTDIEQDDALLKRYMFEIPVIAFEGNDVATWPFSEAKLEDLLLEAFGRERGAGEPGG